VIGESWSRALIHWTHDHSMDAELTFKCVSILFRMPCDLSCVAAAVLSAIAAGGSTGCPVMIMRTTSNEATVVWRQIYGALSDARIKV